MNTQKEAQERDARPRAQGKELDSLHGWPLGGIARPRLTVERDAEGGSRH